jgi:hypothetical protein
MLLALVYLLVVDPMPVSRLGKLGERRKSSPNCSPGRKVVGKMIAPGEVWVALASKSGPRVSTYQESNPCR